MAGRGYKSKGFTFYLREEINRRCGVVTGLYQKRLDSRLPAQRRADHDVVLEEFLGEYGNLQDTATGKPLQKRITSQVKDSQ